MDTLLQLGGFVFRNLEIPEKINFGGEQILVKHQLIGGIRVIDSLGKDDSEMSWGGLITGKDSLARAQQLNKMRAQGIPLNLTWFILNYQVLIQKFIANTERYYQIGYEITLMVITDGDNPNLTQNLVGFNEAILNDAATVTTISNSLNIPAVSVAVTALNAAINAIPTLNGASAIQIATITTPLTNALSAVTTAIVAPATNLFGTTQ